MTKKSAKTKSVTIPDTVVMKNESNKDVTVPNPALVPESCKSVSDKIRFLVAIAEAGDYKSPYSVVATALGKRYQHVRNVMKTPLKRPTT